MQYSIIDTDSNTVIRTEGPFTPTQNPEIIHIQTNDNKFIDPTKDQEFRKIIVEWTWNGGTYEGKGILSYALEKL